MQIVELCDSNSVWSKRRCIPKPRRSLPSLFIFYISLPVTNLECQPIIEFILRMLETSSYMCKLIVYPSGLKNRIISLSLSPMS